MFVIVAENIFPERTSVEIPFYFGEYIILFNFHSTHISDNRVHTKIIRKINRNPVIGYFFDVYETVPVIFI